MKFQSGRPKSRIDSFICDLFEVWSNHYNEYGFRFRYQQLRHFQLNYSTKNMGFLVLLLWSELNQRRDYNFNFRNIMNTMG